MKRNRNLGMFLLAIWLVLTGLVQLISIPIPAFTMIRAGIAIAAGMLILFDR